MSKVNVATPVLPSTERVSLTSGTTGSGTPWMNSMKALLGCTPESAASSWQRSGEALAAGEQEGDESRALLLSCCGDDKLKALTARGMSRESRAETIVGSGKFREARLLSSEIKMK